MKKTASLLALAVCLLTLGACQSMETFKPDENPTKDCSLSKFPRLPGYGRGGKISALEIPTSLGVVRSQRTEALLDKISEPLRKHWGVTDFPTIYVTPSLLTGAFAARDGSIYVTLGTLIDSESEDEVAGVIAHEMGHIACGHVQDDGMWNGLTLLMSPISLSASLAKLPVEMVRRSTVQEGETYHELYDLSVESIRNRGWSRRRERQADAVAIETMLDAKYNHNGLVSTLMRMPDEVDVSTSSIDLGMFSGNSHPSAKERMTLISDYLKAYHPSVAAVPFKSKQLATWKQSVTPMVKSLEHLQTAKAILVNPFRLYNIKPKDRSDDVYGRALKELKLAFPSQKDDKTYLTDLGRGKYAAGNADVQSLAEMFTTRWIATEILAHKIGDTKSAKSAEVKTVMDLANNLLNAPDTPIGYYAFGATMRISNNEYDKSADLLRRAVDKFPKNHAPVCEIVDVINTWLDEKGMSIVQSSCGKPIKKPATNGVSGNKILLGDLFITAARHSMMDQLKTHVEFYMTNGF